MLEINSEIVLSTSHVTYEELQQTNERNYSSDDHCTRLHVESCLTDYTKAGSPNLYKLLELAKVNRCKWLVLDSDGDINKALKVFEW